MSTLKYSLSRHYCAKQMNFIIQAVIDNMPKDEILALAEDIVSRDYTDNRLNVFHQGYYNGRCLHDGYKVVGVCLGVYNHTDCVEILDYCLTKV